MDGEETAMDEDAAGAAPAVAAPATDVSPKIISSPDVSIAFPTALIYFSLFGEWADLVLHPVSSPRS